MLRSLILVALRNIRRDVTYSLINIIGLTIGITGSLILILYVFDDLSYDRYHENSERIYRISSRISEPDDAFNWSVTQVPLAPQLMADYPEVFFWTNTRDDRVHPAHARKMVAKMTDMGHKVYYYENTEGGHAAGANLNQRAYTDALTYAYLWMKLR